MFSILQIIRFINLYILMLIYQTNIRLIKLFFKLIDGGIIVIDDYNLSQFPGAKKAVDEFLLINNVRFFYEIPFGGCYIIK